MSFTFCISISMNYHLLFFCIANIQLIFNTTKYLSDYFHQISNFFVGLLKYEYCIHATINKELSYQTTLLSGCFQHYKDTQIFLSTQ